MDPDNRLKIEKAYNEGWNDAIDFIHEKLKEVGFPDSAKEEEGFLEYIQRNKS